VPRAGASVRRLTVFAVDVDMVQVCWADIAPGSHELVVSGAPTRTIDGGGCGSAIVEGLSPGAEIRVSLSGVDATPVRTLTAPPGPELCRIATISDLHFGERRFGRWPRIASKGIWQGAEPYPVACTRAALDEALAWGAQLIVVKGDLTDEDLNDEFDGLGRVLQTLPVPVIVLPGNHDGGDRVNGDGVAVLARHGVELTTTVKVRDLPGLRVVAASSREPGHHRGNLTPLLPEIADALREAPGGALLATHHPPFRTIVTTIWPPGILGLDGWRLLRAVAAANPATLVTAGHTHRNRRRRYGPVPITEVGSPKDYPGVWAGYVVHEGGIRQVVRRIADPNVLAWTERTGDTVMGQWRRWSPGSLEDRCFSHTWPPRP
jgi:predicted phosphodiesterase